MVFLIPYPTPLPLHRQPLPCSFFHPALTCLLSPDCGLLWVMNCSCCHSSPHCLARGALCPHRAEEACAKEQERRKSRVRWLSIGFWVACGPPSLISFGAISLKGSYHLRPTWVLSPSVTETGSWSHPVLPGFMGIPPEAWVPAQFLCCIPVQPRTTLWQLVLSKTSTPGVAGGRCGPEILLMSCCPDQHPGKENSCLRKYP